MSDSCFEVVCIFIMVAVFGAIVFAIRSAAQDPNVTFRKGVCKVTYEGHEYLIYDRGVCHYPECKCLTKAETKGDNIEEAVTKCNQLKMREALERARRVLHCAIVADILKGEDAHEALNAVTATLSEPPRNCDVGTIDEQLRRFYNFCIPRKCETCPLNAAEDGLMGECGVRWAQTPYENEATDESRDRL